ncbi:MAG TPA: hypothetical protein VFH47_09060, partial [Candidatus Thermoplasmatota archaeon]|nr:hypothetical protein [Candidatus Thermoplasmatota archaeon]
PEDRRRACRPRALPDFPADSSGRHVAFRVDAQNRTLHDVRVEGVLVLERLELGTDEDLEVRRDGRVLRVEGEGFRLELHDDPVGQLRFKADADSTLNLVLPEGASPFEPSGTTRIRYPGGLETFLNAHHAQWNGSSVELHGFAIFHVSARSRPDAQPAPPAEAALEMRKQEAAERRMLGAQVTLRAPSRATDASTMAAAEQVQVVPFDDVHVDVELPPANAPDPVVRVVVSAELSEGRTIALDLEDGLLAADRPDELLLRYYDVNGDGTETEVVFRQAASLQDVLDPTDDAGQPEYWVVADADGLHVLVSVPHWSTHVVTLSSVVEFVTQPSVIVGIVAGASGSVMAAAFLLWPRRRQDPYA